MSLLNAFLGGNIEAIINQYIETIIEEVARNYNVSRNDVEFMVAFTSEEKDSGKYFVVTDNMNNKKKYRISDENLRKLIVNAKKRKG